MAEIDYGSRMKIIRIANNIKQKDMARQLGIAPNRYCNYENNYTRVPADIIADFCRIMNVDADSFLKKEFIFNLK